MRYVTVRTDSGTQAGRVEADDIVLLQAVDVREVLAADYEVDETGRSITLASAELAPVVPSPDKIICIGVNYMDHINEMGRTPPDAPTYFAKYRRSLIGPNDQIHLPPVEVSTAIDWEVELAVVIGKPVRNASASEALDAIAGYAVLNDVSVRDWQRRTTQFLAGKTFERTTPVGPALVTRDELGDGRGLAIELQIDGVVKQSSNTDELRFGPVEIVADLSTIMTLDPGDIIATGTPGGVGAARTPPEYLGPGTEVRSTIEGVGELLNVCVAG